MPYPPHGGVLQRGYNLIREISKYNKVHLLAFIHPEIFGTPEQITESRNELEKYCASVEYFSLWPKKSVIHKFIAVAGGFVYPYPFSVLAHRSSVYARRIDELVKQQSIDLIHYDTIGLAPYLARHRDVPSVLTHHNIESHLMARRAKHESTIFRRFYIDLQAKRLRKCEISQSPRFQSNLMMSKIDELALKEMAPGVRTHVIPNGVDLDYFEPQSATQDIALIYTGGMNMFANKDAVLHLLNDIWPIIKESVPDVKFYAIGQDPPNELIEMSKDDPSIIVTGYVDDVRPFVARAAVYVVPLCVGGGTRLKVLDALAQAKAIVSTSIGCEGINVTDGVNIYIEDTNQGFARRVIELLRNEAERKRLGSAARALVKEEYSWSGIGKLLQQAYEEAVAAANARDVLMPGSS